MKRRGFFLYFDFGFDFVFVFVFVFDFDFVFDLFSFLVFSTNKQTNNLGHCHPTSNIILIKMKMEGKKIQVSTKKKIII